MDLPQFWFAQGGYSISARNARWNVFSGYLNKRISRWDDDLLGPDREPSDEMSSTFTNIPNYSE